MNPQIKQLAQQAGYGSNRWDDTQQFEEFLENFAHTIYKDIVTVVAAQALLNESALDVFKNLKTVYKEWEP